MSTKISKELYLDSTRSKKRDYYGLMLELEKKTEPVTSKTNVQKLLTRRRYAIEMLKKLDYQVSPLTKHKEHWTKELQAVGAELRRRGYNP